MQDGMRMTGLIPKGRSFDTVELFGYSTRGVPGLELVGPAKVCKLLKEKIIYFTRMEGLNIQAKRFVICIDTHEDLKDIRAHAFRFLEIPILIMYWAMSGHLKIRRLDDCICYGHLLASGEIINLPIPEDALYRLDKNWQEEGKGRIKYLTSSENVENIDKKIASIDIETFFGKRNFLHVRDLAKIALQKNNYSAELLQI